MPVFYGNVGGIEHRAVQPEGDGLRFCPRCGRHMPKESFEEGSRLCAPCREAGPAERVPAPRHRKPAPKKGRGRRVVCLETGAVFESMKEAAVAVGANSGGISLCINGGALTAKGYHWVLEGDGRTVAQIEEGRRGAKRVVCLDTGEVYASVKAAAAAAGTSPASVIKCAKGRYGTAGGLHWAYAGSNGSEGE